jgi:hypothetical protein
VPRDRRACPRGQAEMQRHMQPLAGEDELRQWLEGSGLNQNQILSVAPGQAAASPALVSADVSLSTTSDPRDTAKAHADLKSDIFQCPISVASRSFELNVPPIRYPF